MSFSSMVKNELCRLDINNECCMAAELAAVIKTGGNIKLSGNNETNIIIVTENAAFARRMFTVIRKLYRICPEVMSRKNNKLKKHAAYILVITSLLGARSILEEMGIYDGMNINKDVEVNYRKLKKVEEIKNSCCRKAYLRGAFLSGGSISDPEKTYHLEITNRDYELACELNKLMKEYGLRPKTIKRKNSYVSYLKEGENIVDFLNVIGAHTALLELENVRILKDMRNNVNRIVNCETANLEKTVNASVRQVENIKYIREHLGFDALPENLRQVAELRLQYSDASLKELGQLLTPSLGKSGVNHRLRKLDNIAEREKAIRGDCK